MIFKIVTVAVPVLRSSSLLKVNPQSQRLQNDHQGILSWIAERSARGQEKDVPVELHRTELNLFAL